MVRTLVAATVIGEAQVGVEAEAEADAREDGLSERKLSGDGDLREAAVR